MWWVGSEKSIDRWLLLSRRLPTRSFTQESCYFQILSQEKVLQDLSPLWFLVFRSLLQKGDTFNTFTFLLLNSMGIKLTFLLLAKHLFLPVVLSGIWPEGMGEWHKLPAGYNSSWRCHGDISVNCNFIPKHWRSSSYAKPQNSHLDQTVIASSFDKVHLAAEFQ